MFQIAYNYHQDWREDESLTVDIQVSQKIAISPDLARRRANGFLAGHVTMMVSAGQPTLIVDQTPVWRVPAVLRLPELGDVSTVGAVDIDAQTGDMILPSFDQITRMQELAHAIAAHFASATTATG
jgi:hypothetical protein